MNDRKKNSPPLVFGEVLFDELKHHSTQTKKILGGAPFNVAWNLTMFGLSPFLISAVGKDEQGEKVLSAMQQNQMPTNFVSHSLSPTGVVEVFLTNGQPQYTIVDNTAYDDIQISSQQWEFLKQDMFSNTILYHGSLALRHQKNQEQLQKLIDCCSVQTFFDVNLRSPWYSKKAILSYLPQTSWLKLNEQEFHEIFFPIDFPLKQEAKEKIFALIKEFDLQGIILTAGTLGAAVFTKDQFYFSKATLQKSFKDAVGAGDAFSSVFILGILLKKEKEEVLKQAIEFASAVCSLHGATTLDKAFYFNIIKGWF